jgi:hypothetical protein
MQTTVTNSAFRSGKRIRLRWAVVVSVAVALAGFLFHTSYRMLTGLNFPELPLGTAAAPPYKEAISPDGNYRVRLTGGKTSRIQLILLPTNQSIDQKQIANYVVLDTNWDAQVYYVWKTPQDLVVYCALCTPIRVARALPRLGDLRIEYKFPPQTTDDSTVVIETPPDLPADEQKEYENKFRRIREAHPYRF